MRVATIGAVAVLCGCASAPDPAAGRPVMQSVEVVGTSQRLSIGASDAPVKKSVGAPVEQVWRSLPAVFDSLAIPIAMLDGRTHTIGTENAKVRQRLGKVALSRYLDCGTTQIGPNADSYQVFLTVFVTAGSGANGTTDLTITIDANAQPIAFSQAASHCSSKGVLEARILELTSAQARR